jgi:DNA-directed RNA polymerase subunit M/transcription elongation factor TFIIS
MTIVSITPPIRDACRQELIKVCQGTKVYAEQLELCIWQWSQNQIPKIKPGKDSKSASSSSSSSSLPASVNSNILYEMKFKQLIHNLNFNCQYLLDRYAPDMLVWLDDTSLACSTRFEHLREETTQRARKLQEIMTSLGDLPMPAVPGLPDKATFLRCRKCNSTDVQFNQKQISSGDEGMTSFVTCKNCGQKWKMS